MSLILRTLRITPIVLALLALASFGDAHAHDRTAVLKSTTRNDFTVRVNVVLDAQYIDDVCRSVFADLAKNAARPLIQDPPADHTLNSCSVWNEAEYRLDIYVVEPQFVDDTVGFSHIGHELWHGVRGLFHP